jgi:hypothetical protein
MIKKVVRKVLKEEHPDLHSIHYPVKAVITKVHGDSELVDIKMLDKDGNIDSRFPEIPKVKTLNTFKIDEIVIVNRSEITVDTYYGQRQVSFPDTLEVDGKVIYKADDIVRVGFYYNDLSMPYIDGKVE